MPGDIFVAHSDEDILSCFPAFSALRPHLQEQAFLSQVRRHAAHRLYLRKGLQLNCHHLALDLGQG